MISLRESNAGVEVSPGGLSTAVTITFHGGARPLSWGLTREEAIALATELVALSEREVAA